MKIKISPIDKLFSLYVRLRADGLCEYCGSATSRLECSHFHGRRKRSTRWDPDNACALCFSCHRYLGENPYRHTAFFAARLGSDRFEKLNIRAEMTFPKPNLDIIKADLEQKIKFLEEVSNG